MGGGARDEYFNFDQFTTRLRDKLDRFAADRIALEMAGLGAENSASVREFLYSLPPSQFRRITVLR